MGTVELILFAIMGLLLLGMIGLSIYALTRMNEISQICFLKCWHPSSTK